MGKGVDGVDTKAGEALADTVVGADTKAGDRAVAGESGAGTTTLAEGNAANAGAGGATRGGAGNEFRKPHMSSWVMRAARTLFRTSTCTCLTTSSTVLVSWLYSNKSKKARRVKIKNDFCFLHAQATWYTRCYILGWSITTKCNT